MQCTYKGKELDYLNKLRQSFYHPNCLPFVACFSVNVIKIFKSCKCPCFFFFFKQILRFWRQQSVFALRLTSYLKTCSLWASVIFPVHFVSSECWRRFALRLTSYLKICSLWASVIFSVHFVSSECWRRQNIPRKCTFALVSIFWIL